MSHEYNWCGNHHGDGRSCFTSCVVVVARQRRFLITPVVRIFLFIFVFPFFFFVLAAGYLSALRACRTLCPSGPSPFSHPLFGVLPPTLPAFDAACPSSPPPLPPARSLCPRSRRASRAGVRGRVSWALVVLPESFRSLFARKNISRKYENETPTSSSSTGCRR